jgi:phosphatidylglycerophosphate synthase
MIRYSLKDIRGAYKARSSWWGYFILHPMAVVALWPVANFMPRVRPELLCVTSFWFGLCSVLCFLIGSPGWVMAGGMLALISNIFDSMDGKLARLKGQANALGGYLDTAFDILKHSLMLWALIWGLFIHCHCLAKVMWGSLMLIVLLWNYANENLLGRIRLGLPAPDTPEVASAITPTSASGLKGLAQRWTAYCRSKGLLPVPCGVELLTVMFIVGPLTNTVWPCLVIGSVGFAVYSAIYTVSTLKSTRWLTVGVMKEPKSL